MDQHPALWRDSGLRDGSGRNLVLRHEVLPITLSRLGVLSLVAEQRSSNPVEVLGRVLMVLYTLVGYAFGPQPVMSNVIRRGAAVASGPRCSLRDLEFGPEHLCVPGARPPSDTTCSTRPHLGGHQPAGCVVGQAQAGTSATAAVALGHVLDHRRRGRPPVDASARRQLTGGMRPASMTCV
jgi:hypothetical protein